MAETVAEKSERTVNEHLKDAVASLRSAADILETQCAQLRVMGGQALRIMEDGKTQATALKSVIAALEGLSDDE